MNKLRNQIILLVVIFLASNCQKITKNNTEETSENVKKTEKIDFAPKVQKKDEKKKRTHSILQKVATIEEKIKPKKRKLPKNYVVFGSDTILVKDEIENEGGKVWGVSKFNSEIYYYFTFKGLIKETGIYSKNIGT